MSVVGESENYGTEQEHLNNVFGARLRITSLHARGGPGVELLEYLVPRTGRPMPPGSLTDDLWAWQTTLSVPSTSALERSLRSDRIDLVSPASVTFHDSPFGFVDALLVRDPDGHLLRVTHP